MPCAFQLLASLADGCEKGPTTPTTSTTAAAAAEGASESEAITTAAPRRRRDLQVSVIRKGRQCPNPKEGT